MKKKNKTVRKAYLKPNISVVQVEESYCLLAGSPSVRPGNGGEGAQQGNINVVPIVSDDNNPDDELEG
ncbi:hypothetical protein [Prevotella intermedia]|uniref:Uncharacterized protein n=1 Tax=Prevotella intermedia TaxID=28131 RepID=A0A2G9IEB9_PREIN|nr:hypothetical protein [Prevotella intermedia]PIN28098.1 hypothetical protein CUC04_00950 [Prevotella intermedia]